MPTIEFNIFNIYFNYRQSHIVSASQVSQALGPTKPSHGRQATNCLSLQKFEHKKKKNPKRKPARPRPSRLTFHQADRSRQPQVEHGVRRRAMYALIPKVEKADKDGLLARGRIRTCRPIQLQLLLSCCSRQRTAIVAPVNQKTTTSDSERL